MVTRQVEKFKDWLRFEKNFNAVFALIAGLIAFWKGFRLPYNWAATQAQFDYRFGLVRLGLFGEICRRLHLHIIDYRVFSAVALFLLFVLLFLTIRTAIRSGLAQPVSGLFIVLIAGSYCVSFTINLVGYLDIVLAILLLLALRAQGYAWQIAAAGVAAIVGCLVHEVYLVVFLPLSLMHLVRRAEDESFKLLYILPLLAFTLLPALLVLRLCGHVALNPQQMDAFLQDWHAHANFPVRDDYFGVLKRPLSQCFAEARTYFRAGEWWLEELFYAAAFFPTILYFLFVAGRFQGEKHRWTKRYVTLAVLCPMALNFIAVDFYRWMNFTALNAMFAAIASARSPERKDGVPAPQKEFGVLAKNTALVLIAVNLATSGGTFLPMTDFPFLAHWRRFRENRLLHRPLFQFTRPRDYKFREDQNQEQ